MNKRLHSVEGFLSLLQKVKQDKPNQWMALCPGHKDRERSLSITSTDDRILVHCFAGCPVEQVLAPLNLTTADLSLRSLKLPDREIEAIYHYIDAKGKPFEVVRTRPKGFYQRQPDGLEGYANNLKGITPTLYHQDELKEAIANAKPIFFVEGEKDTDRLRSLGLVATTNPMGAGKWRTGYTKALEGADLIIIPDKDDAGHNHAYNIVAKFCHGTAKRIRMLDLPGEVIDVSDWLDRGGDLDQLQQLAADAPDYEPPPLPEKVFNLTDQGNGERLARRHGENIHYSEERKRWLIWSGKVWGWDYGAKVMSLAKETVRNILREAADEKDDDQRKELIKHAVRSESGLRLTAMITLAQSEPRIPIQNKDLNSNPWLFNCLNGTINLKTGELLPHSRGDLVTIMSPINYDPNARCELWLKFLDRITGGSIELAQYLQRAVGYSLTGDMRAQVLFFLFGLGNNGKSTFIATIRKIMAGYGATAPVDMFLAKDTTSRGPKEDLANLQGKRFIAASEVEVGRKLAVVLIKEMTGGEAITADRKYEHEVEFQPTHKLWLSGNHKPVVQDTSLAIWRRIKLIPFTVTIPDNEIDEDLPFKMETELSSILTWAVKGCLAWQQAGLIEPREVTAATLAYRSEEDILAEFIQDCCSLKATATVPKANLQERYKQWCEATDSQPVYQKTLRTRLMERGITEGKSGSVRYWRGITLIEGKEGQMGQMGQEMTFSRETPIREELQGKVPGNWSPAVPSVPRKDLNLPPVYPNKPCPTCGCKDYRLTDDNRWLCSRCYPEPEGKEVRDGVL